MMWILFYNGDVKTKDGSCRSEIKKRKEVPIKWRARVRESQEAVMVYFVGEQSWSFMGTTVDDDAAGAVVVMAGTQKPNSTCFE